MPEITKQVPYQEALDEMNRLGGRVVIRGRIAVGEAQLTTIYKQLGWTDAAQSPTAKTTSGKKAKAAG